MSECIYSFQYNYIPQIVNRPNHPTASTEPRPSRNISTLKTDGQPGAEAFVKC